MANLIEYIQSQVYENSTEDISGSIMQQVLTRMASDEGVVNVHTISGQTPFADYNNAQAARDAVPAGFKKLGLIITYKLSSGWYVDEFIGSATSGWSTASNWKCLGPISVSQNASTGKTTITIGSQSYDVATQPVSVSQNIQKGKTSILIGNEEPVNVAGESVAEAFPHKVFSNGTTNDKALKDDGDVVYQAGFYTSELIEIEHNILNTIRFNCLPKNGGYCGLALYDEDNTFIVAFGGYGVLELSNYPTAKYIRYCMGNVELINDRDSVISAFDNTTFEANNYILKQDGTNQYFAGYYTSGKCPVVYPYTILNGNLTHKDATTYCGLVVYDSSDNVLATFGDSVDVDLSTIENASYFKFCVTMSDSSKHLSIIKKGGLAELSNNMNRLLAMGLLNVNKELVFSANISTVLPDANNAKENTIYIFATNTFPSNMPSWFGTAEASTHSPKIMLKTYRSDILTFQFICDRETEELLWYRYKSGTTWYAWNSYQHKISVLSNSTNVGWEFNKLYDALKFAKNNKNTRIDIYKGTYDLISEMGADITSSNFGNLLSAGMQLIFHEKTLVTCNYTGSDDGIMENFSPFMTGEGDWEIYGLTIQASKVRYIIHDDIGTSQYHYKHTIKNCNFYLDNSESTWRGKQCIGGGLGQNGTVEIENCIFESVGVDASTHDDVNSEVSYHNTSLGNAQSRIWIKDCYFTNSSCSFGYYGDSILITPVCVCGCSMKWQPLVRQQNVAYNNVNITLKAWNNEIRE